MDRDRTVRPAAHAPGLVALAAFPLVLTSSAVGVTLTSSGGVPDQASPPSAVGGEPAAGESTSGGSTSAVPAALGAPERPWLGSARPGDIPWPALQAYQRADEVLGEVEPGCGVSWQLLAAVGQVESEHGQALGGAPGDDGVVRPAMVGRPLDGEGSRPRVDDTDGGVVDGDETWDRPVGPMQLLPATWAITGVDGDGDGSRSAQDIDDAALAAGVYLCATGPGLEDDERVAEALLSYNDSEEYVEQVLAVAAKYRMDGFGIAGQPGPQSIGELLDYGSGTAAEQDSDRALREARNGSARGTDSDDATGETERETVTAGPARSEGADDSKIEPSSPSDEQSESPEEKSPEEGTPGSGEESDAPQESDIVEERPGLDGTPGTPDEGTDPAGDEAESATDVESAEEAESREGAASEQSRGSAPARSGEGGPGTAGTPEERTANEDEQTEDGAGADGEADSPEEPETSILTGALAACGETGESHCVDGMLLDLSAAEDLSASLGDLDGDGTTSPVADELAGLEGEAVEVVVLEGSEPLFVVAINGIALRRA
jgi:hypothetical protein